MLQFYLNILDDSQEQSKFEVIYQKYCRRMKALAWRFLDHEEDAEDAVQESFMKLIKCLGHIRKPVSKETEAFIVMIVKNTCYDMLRKQQGRQSCPLDELEPQHLSVKVNLFENMDVERVFDAIDELSERDREILLLKAYYGLSNECIAEILCIPYMTAAKRLERARTNLQTALEKRGAEV